MSNLIIPKFYKFQDGDYYKLQSYNNWIKEYELTIDKIEYPDFECWWYDMEKCGLIVEC